MDIQSSLDLINLYAGMHPVYSLFSGGKDSVATTHIAAQMDNFAGCIHVRTGTGPLSDEATQDVLALCEAQGWPLMVVESPELYEQFVIAKGFPGPAAHRWIYIALKEKAIRRAKKQISKHATFVTGIRRYESQRRQNAPDAQRISGTWWLSPILDWTRDDVLTYVAAHNLPHLEGKSQECLCGAFARPGERETIRQLSQGHAAWLDYMERMVQLSRERQLLEVQLGHRAAADVIPEHACIWGHGNGSSAEAPTDDGYDGITLCNDCAGQLDESGSVGVDYDALMREIKAK